VPTRKGVGITSYYADYAEIKCDIVSELVILAQHLSLERLNNIMILNNRISAVLVSTDLDKSRDFYENKLGLPLSTKTIKNHLLFECGDGTTLLIYGRAAGNKADHTQVRFWSTDVEADVKALVANGVVFDDFDMGTIKTINHVATVPGIGKSAWFKDPDGNTLAVFQPE
jgi:catechol 2,3-dioxygenase-like lactoylglutathione lyase family enzyme